MKTIIGLFDDYSRAEAAVSLLVGRGCDPADISIVETEAARPWGRDMPDVEQRDRRRVAMAEAGGTGAGAGAALGAGAGGIVGVLAGAGAVVLPGIGPVLAAGPLLAGLVGAGVGAVAGGIVGGLVGALTQIGVPDRDAQGARVFVL